MLVVTSEKQPATSAVIGRSLTRTLSGNPRMCDLATLLRASQQTAAACADAEEQRRRWRQRRTAAAAADSGTSDSGAGSKGSSSSSSSGSNGSGEPGGGPPTELGAPPDGAQRAYLPPSHPSDRLDPQLARRNPLSHGKHTPHLATTRIVQLQCESHSCVSAMRLLVYIMLSVCSFHIATCVALHPAC